MSERWLNNLTFCLSRPIITNKEFGTMSLRFTLIFRWVTKVNYCVDAFQRLAFRLETIISRERLGLWWHCAIWSRVTDKSLSNTLRPVTTQPPFFIQRALQWNSTFCVVDSEIITAKLLEIFWSTCRREQNVVVIAQWAANTAQWQITQLL